MESLLTSSNIMFSIGLLGIIFSVFFYFKNPQVQIEKEIIKERAKTDKDDGLIAQQIKYITESTERRFGEIQKNFESLLLQSNNHIHTVDTKVEALSVNVINMGNNITELSTIINERIPKK